MSEEKVDARGFSKRLRLGALRGTGDWFFPKRGARYLDAANIRIVGRPKLVEEPTQTGDTNV